MTTETLTPTTEPPTTEPRTAPLEPTTPIRPSEAIRLGCLLAPVQTDGEWGYGEHACVNRALVLGMTGDDEGYSQYLTVDRLLVGIKPPCGWACMDSWAGPHRSPSWVLIHLNDSLRHRWSRERIADWLEGLGL